MPISTRERVPSRPNPLLWVVLTACIMAAACDPGTEPVVFPPGPLGAVTLGADEAIQIRSLLAMTGAPNLGTPTRNAVELAVRDVGKIRGREVELGLPIDDECSPAGGRTGATEILSDSKVVGVIGTTCSAAAVEASFVLGQGGLSMIAPSTTSPLLTSDLQGNPGVHYHPGYQRLANNDLYQALAVADFAYNSVGLRRVVAVHDGDAYTSSLANAFADAFSAVGGDVPVVASIEKGQIDMSTVLAEFVAAEPDAIFLPLFLTEGYPLVAQTKQFEGLEEVTLIGGSALLVSDFLARPESEGVFLAGTETNFGTNTNSATGKNWADLLVDYEATYSGKPQSPYWAHGYDATTMLLGAIDAVGIEDGDRLFIDRAALREELMGTNFNGLIGRIVCDEFGDCGTGRVNLYHHGDPNVTDVTLLEVVYEFAPEHRDPT